MLVDTQRLLCGHGRAFIGNQTGVVGTPSLPPALLISIFLEEAKEAVDNFLENCPLETISKLRNAMVIAGKPDHVHRFEEGLRKAGLPE